MNSGAPRPTVAMQLVAHAIDDLGHSFTNFRLVPVDLPTITGVDRRVSIRTTSAISRTSAPDTAGSDWPRLRPADTSQLNLYPVIGCSSGPAQTATACNRSWKEWR